MTKCEYILWVTMLCFPVGCSKGQQGRELEGLRVAGAPVRVSCQTGSTTEVKVVLSGSLETLQELEGIESGCSCVSGTLSKIEGKSRFATLRVNADGLSNKSSAKDLVFRRTGKGPLKFQDLLEINVERHVVVTPPVISLSSVGSDQELEASFSLEFTNPDTELISISGGDEFDVIFKKTKTGVSGQIKRLAPLVSGPVSGEICVAYELKSKELHQVFVQVHGSVPDVARTMRALFTAKRCGTSPMWEGSFNLETYSSCDFHIDEIKTSTGTVSHGEKHDFSSRAEIPIVISLDHIGSGDIQIIPCSVKGKLLSGRGEEFTVSFNVACIADPKYRE